MSDWKFCGRNNSPSRKRTVGIVDVKVFLKFTSTCKKKIHIQLHEYWTCNYTPGNKLQGVYIMFLIISHSAQVFLVCFNNSFETAAQNFKNLLGPMWYVHNSWKFWFHYFSGKFWPFWSANVGHIPVLNIVVNSLSVELLLNHCTEFHKTL